MVHDGNRDYYESLADKNLEQASAGQTEIRNMRVDPTGHTRADVDVAERAAKDAIGRAADAVRVLVDVGD